MPEVPAHEKVLVSMDYLRNDPHASIRCITCHSGRDGFLPKDSAHVGLIRDPSAENGGGVCRNCHEGIVNAHRQSIHYTQAGYHGQFVKRGGDTTHSQYWPMFERRCIACHTTCGECHISMPRSVKSGFVNGHRFNRTPNQDLNCIACHGARVGADFRGEVPGGSADVHHRRGMTCMSCHNEFEMHSAKSNQTYPHRYNVTPRASCTQCHNLSNSTNPQHGLQHSRVQCNVCHSVKIKSCYSCHAMDTGFVVDTTSFDFKIGRNPRLDRNEYDYVVVRHIPISPNTYMQPWNLSLPNYINDATWMMATPHNIQKHTPQNSRVVIDSLGRRTTIPVCNNCHGRNEFFLTESFLDSLIQHGLMHEIERDANRNVITNAPPLIPGKHEN
ncbi:MAG: hypothetical protein N2450_02795 [bacterium]|nr:hypothetical protein [bacterium]